MWLRKNLNFLIPIIKTTIKEEIQDSIDSDILPNKVNSINKYLDYMEKQQSYGGQDEIIALSHVLNRNINVYKSGNDYEDTGL